MSLKILADRDDSDAGSVTSSQDQPAPDRRARLGTVLALVGAGLLLQGTGDALDRTGHHSWAFPLFLVGVTVIFMACASRLTSSGATRAERIWISLVLGVGLLASYVMHHPLLLNSFDELAHGATLRRLLDDRPLFPTNSIVPVSPYYPGLELVTLTTRWLTGLPLVIDQLIVLLAARIVLILCIFLTVERACRSSRAGGIGVLAYAASPEFYGFDTQYAYETLALAFAVAAVYLLFVSVDRPQPRTGRLFALALVCLAAMILTHHVTSWLTVGFLVIWAVGLRLVVEAPAQPAQNGDEPQPGSRVSFRSRIGLGSGQSGRRMQQARVVGLAAMVGLVLGGVWTAFVGSRVTAYVGPIFSAAAADISTALGQFHGNRQLFRNSAGGSPPIWAIALIVAAVVAWCLILLPALYSAIWRRSVRGGKLRYLPVVIAATYPLAMLANVSSESKLVAGRATTFIFLGVAVVVGGWLAGRLSRSRRCVEVVATVAVATVCFLGSLLFGGGTVPSYVPGPYRVGADDLSLGSPSLALANWVAAHIPPGTHVAADRDNGALLNDIGGVDPVTANEGLIDPAPLFFDHQLTAFDLSLIRAGGIRYIVIDDRLAEGLPLYGTYIADGEPDVRLTMAELDKFNSIPLARRVYDNGPIQMYDLSALVGKRPLRVSAGPTVTTGGPGLDVGIFVIAALVGVVWLVRLRRRDRLVRINEHRVVCGVVGALAIGVFGGLAVRLVELPASGTALVILVVLLALGLRPMVRPWRDLRASQGQGQRSPMAMAANILSRPGDPVRYRAPDPGGTTATGPTETRAVSPGSGPAAGVGADGRSRLQILLGCTGVALFALGASLATVTAFKEWIPPPELSVISGPPGQTVADVQLGSAGPMNGRIYVAAPGRLLWSARLSPTASPQSVVLPAHDLTRRSRVYIASGLDVVRVVDG